jgi:hypothetical protein
VAVSGTERQLVVLAEVRAHSPAGRSYIRADTKPLPRAAATCMDRVFDPHAAGDRIFRSGQCLRGLESAQRVIVEDHAGDAAVGGQHPRLWLDLLRGEDAADRGERGIAVE